MRPGCVIGNFQSIKAIFGADGILSRDNGLKVLHATRSPHMKDTPPSPGQSPFPVCILRKVEARFHAGGIDPEADLLGAGEGSL